MYVNTYYNLPKNPNLRNTNRMFFNCGGYALGTFKWYYPAKSNKAYDRIDSALAKGDYIHATTLAVSHMIKEFGFSIVSGEEIKAKMINFKNIEIIAFRFELDAESRDFHFMKLGANGSWYEKRGSRPFIYRHNYDYVFEDWAGRYDGPIAFLIRPRERI